MAPRALQARLARRYQIVQLRFPFIVRACIRAETRLQLSECLERRVSLLTRHAPPWRPLDTHTRRTSRLGLTRVRHFKMAEVGCIRLRLRASPSLADELAQNHRPDSAFAAVLELLIDPRIRTKGRRVRGRRAWLRRLLSRSPAIRRP